MDHTTLSQCFEASCLRFQKKTAITFYRKRSPETEISYKTLDRDANRTADTFRRMGVEKGDRVILFFPKSVLFVVAHLGLQKIGAISVPLNTGFKKSEMEYFVQDATPKLILAGAEQEALIRETAPGVSITVFDTNLPYEKQDFFRAASDERPETQIDADDPAVIIYTSGTTGKPKGAVLTHGNLVHDAKNIMTIWEIRDSDVLCHALPLFHVHGLCFALHTCLLAGSHVLLLDAFAPEIVVPLLAGSAGNPVCSIFMAVPSMYTRMMDFAEGKALSFDRVRLWASGSAPLLPKDFERMRSCFGKEPVEREGMSETGMNFSNPLRGVRKPGSIGLPLPGVEVRIVDPETLEDVAPGKVGEIWLKGPSVTPGYWRKPEETAKAFVDGWFRSGDLGRTDEEGYHTLTDRLKHIIISGGENISPKEVEVVINRMDGVSESCVVGVPDEKWGEKVVAAVVPKQGFNLDSQAVAVFCKEKLHSWKCPKDIRLLDALPRNTMGKVLKKEVERLFLP
ncbi:MAG: AMP-binding protein [Deltaproteobacteria bacterium]|nr:AMP-binding protein [Deltaproteobacteria bacterium]